MSLACKIVAAKYFANILFTLLKEHLQYSDKEVGILFVSETSKKFSADF